MKRWTEQAAREQILKFYDDGGIWVEAAAFRRDTDHQEVIQGDGEAVCAVCGLLGQPTAHPLYHPEQWVDDNGELLEEVHATSQSPSTSTGLSQG